MASPSPPENSGPAAAALAPHLPVTLDVIDVASASFVRPVKRIHQGHDVARFLRSLAYRDIGTFVLQLNRALCPRQQPASALPRLFPLPAPGSSPPSTPSIRALQHLLVDLESFVAQAPPDPGPRRFGNASFRKWHALVEHKLPDLLGAGLLGDRLGAARCEVESYLLGAFGNPQRLDYGTGHELSFLAFVGCLWKLGFFSDGKQDGDIERDIVLKVIEL